MPATVHPFRPPARSQDPALAAALAELTELGLTVARVVARLAQVEDAALDVLAANAVAATQALATPPASLAEARRVGHDADTSEAARDAAVARVAAVAECFDKAARAVRRTVALQARLLSGRPFPELPAVAAAASATQARPAPPAAASRARGGSDAEHPDRPELGDELGAATDEEALHAIRRDLSATAGTLTHLSPQLAGPAKPAPPTHAAAPAPLPDKPPAALPPATPLPAPDT